MIRIFKKNEKSDEELLSHFVTNQNMDALGKLFERYLPLVFGVCLKYLKNREEAKDETMAIYELCVLKLPNQTVIHFKSWLYKVTVNHCLMQIRKKNKEITLLPDMEFESDSHLIDKKLGQEEKINWVSYCIEQLKETQKRCVAMFFIQEMSYEEIKEKTGYSYNEVKSNIQNGKRNLKICLEQNIKNDG